MVLSVLLFLQRPYDSTVAVNKSKCMLYVCMYFVLARGPKVAIQRKHFPCELRADLYLFGISRARRMGLATVLIHIVHACTYLACTAHSSNVHEWIFFKFEILLSDNQTNTLTSTSRYIYLCVHIAGIPSCVWIL